MITINKTIKRQTKGFLPVNAGRDRGKRLVVRIEDGDMLVLGPKRAKSQRAIVRVSLMEIYMTKMGRINL